MSVNLIVIHAMASGRQNILRTADLESHKTLPGVAGLDIGVIGNDVF